MRRAGRRAGGLLVLSVAAGVVALVGAGAAFGRLPGSTRGDVEARRLSASPVRERHGWQRYDEAPSTAVVRPVRLTQVTGDVANAQALIAPGGAATLTYAAGGRPPSLVLDYGKDVSGVPDFDVAATSGTTLSATYSEPFYNLGNDGAGSVGLFASGNSGRTDTFTLAHPGAVRASLIQGGQRYERLTLTTPGTVSLRSAGIDFTAPRETAALMRGRFFSSDGLLNRIWFAGAYTLNLNELTPGTGLTAGVSSRRHYILDGAKRDRAIWSGDHEISDLTAYYVDDPLYARDSLALLLTHPATRATKLGLATGSLSQPGPLPGVCSPNPVSGKCLTWSASYSALVIPALDNYYLYTGDLRFVRSHWQAVVRQMAWDAQQVDRRGLFAVDSADGADWNLEDITGELTYVNAVYVLALHSASRLATALGDRAHAREWSLTAVGITRSMNRRLWDPRTGVYDASTRQRRSFVQDANVTAVLAGVAAPARARGILRRLQTALQGPFGLETVSAPAPTGFTRWTSPYMGSFHVLADFAAGDEAAALSNIRREWGYMVGQDPGGVEWERIQPGGKLVPGVLSDSAAHAWSTGPTPALSQYVLGVRPASPGFVRWLVGPRPAGLSWAQGVVPTPRGPLTVRWERGPRHGFFKLTVIAPRGESGSVSVPLLGHRRVIAVDGRVVWDGRRAVGPWSARVTGGAVSFPSIRGRHTFAWS